jgi:FxLD family lantipeptide
LRQVPLTVCARLSAGYATSRAVRNTGRKDSIMSVATTEGLPGGSAIDDDPFGLDITFIENIPSAESPMMCATDDTCGSSCPSACTTS